MHLTSVLTQTWKKFGKSWPRYSQAQRTNRALHQAISDFHVLHDTLTFPCNNLASANCTSASHWCSYVDMGRRPSLSSNKRAHALWMLQSGLSTPQVAATFRVAYSTMSRLIIRFNATNSVNYLRRSGCPKATTHRQDNLIWTLTLRNHKITKWAFQGQFGTAAGVTVSDQTIRNRLHAAGLRTSCCAYSSETTSQDTSFDLVPTSFAMEWTPVV